MAKPKQMSTAVGVDLTKALAHGSSGIRKKMRDITRLLQRDNLAADMRIANERALKTLKLELQKIQGDQKERKLAQKYHKVRFFERKKAIRFYMKSKKNLESFETQLAEAEKKDDKEAVKELKKQLKKEKRVFRHSQIDLAYVLNFPKNEKYIALYATSTIPLDKLPKKAKDGIKASNDRKEEFKKIFAEQLKQGQLEVSIEEGLGKDRTEEAAQNSGKNKGTGAHVHKETQQVDDVEAVVEHEKDDFFE